MLYLFSNSFGHQELVHTVTEGKKRRMLRILRDERKATLKVFRKKIPGEKGLIISNVTTGLTMTLLSPVVTFTDLAASKSKRRAVLFPSAKSKGRTNSI